MDCHIVFATIGAFVKKLVTEADRHAPADYRRVSQAVGADRAASSKAGKESKTGAGRGLAE